MTDLWFHYPVALSTTLCVRYVISVVMRILHTPTAVVPETLDNLSISFDDFQVMMYVVCIICV